MLNILDEEGIIADAIRSIFAAINDGIYTLIAITYNLIEDLANVSVLSYGDMQKFASRIYALLGLFMLFKVSFSIITYILDPNKMADSNTGFSAIIKNTVITLILILTVPMAFNLLYEAQAAILEDNVIPKLILGNDSEMSGTTAGTKLDATNTETMNKNLQIYFSPDYCEHPLLAKDTGQYIALLTFRPFFQPNDSFTKEDFEGRGNAAATRYCIPESSPIIDDAGDLFSIAGTAWKVVTIPITGPITGLKMLLHADDNEADSGSYDSQMNDAIKKYNNGTSEVTIDSYLGDESIYNSANGTDFIGWSDYDIDFNYFVAMLVGIFVELLMISIAFDVAVRSVKLAFLQLISPIPIVSYIDPKNGKDGMFKNWYKEVFKTWASLFVRLIAIFFGVYLIQQINGTIYLINDQKEPLSGHFWIMLFLLIGVLMFMKQLPSLIETLIPGMKGSGSLNLNPFKKVADGAIGGKFIAGAATGLGAAGIASVGGATANAIAADRGNKMRNFGKGLFTGAYYGAKGGLKNGLSGKYNFGRAGYDAIKDNSKFRNKTDDLEKAGVNGPFKLARQAVRDEYTDVIGKRGSTGTTSLIKNQIKEAELNLANAQRDEQSAAQAMDYIKARDGGEKASMYESAFKTSVQKDSNGDFQYVKENGQNYREWVNNMEGGGATEQIKKWEQEARTTLQAGPDWAKMDEKQRQLAIDKEIDSKVSTYYGDRYLTADEYNNYNSLYEARNNADIAGRKYTKEIESKKELYGKTKGKGE